MLAHNIPKGTLEVLYLISNQSPPPDQMTYKELLDQLQQLNEEQLNQDVAIWDEDNDEYYQQDVDLLFVDDTQDVLDVDHPIIRF